MLDPIRCPHTHAEGRAQLAEESADEAGGEGAWSMTSRSVQRKANDEDKQSSPTNPQGTEEKGNSSRRSEKSTTGPPANDERGCSESDGVRFEKN